MDRDLTMQLYEKLQKYLPQKIYSQDMHKPVLGRWDIYIWTCGKKLQGSVVKKLQS